MDFFNCSYFFILGFNFKDCYRKAYQFCAVRKAILIIVTSSGILVGNGSLSKEPCKKCCCLVLKGNPDWR